MTLYDKINEAVRDFFAAGHKSGNKMYDRQAVFAANPKPTNAFVQMKKINKRNLEMSKSQQHRIDWENTPVGSHYDSAKLILAMPTDDRSGNCGEMADVAGYFAVERHNILGRWSISASSPTRVTTCFA